MKKIAMKRIEIFANQSVQEEITQGLESAVPDMLYSISENVFGKGKRDRKLGNATWPETNFVLISYAKESDCDKIFRAINNVKKRFPTEGIAYFISDAAKITDDYADNI